jgi:hypothetical protein
MLDKKWDVRFEQQRVIVGDLGSSHPAVLSRSGIGNHIRAYVVYEDDKGQMQEVPLMTTAWTVDEHGNPNEVKAPMPPDFVAHIVQCHNKCLEDRKI